MALVGHILTWEKKDEYTPEGTYKNFNDKSNVWDILWKARLGHEEEEMKGLLKLVQSSRKRLRVWEWGQLTACQTSTAMSGFSEQVCGTMLKPAEQTRVFSPLCLTLRFCKIQHDCCSLKADKWFPHLEKKWEEKTNSQHSCPQEGCISKWDTPREGWAGGHPQTESSVRLHRTILVKKLREQLPVSGHSGHSGFYQRSAWTAGLSVRLGKKGDY